MEEEARAAGTSGKNDKSDPGGGGKGEVLCPILITNPRRNFVVRETDFVIVLPAPTRATDVHGRPKHGTVNKRRDGTHRGTHMQLSSSLKVPFGYRSPHRPAPPMNVNQGKGKEGQAVQPRIGKRNKLVGSFLQRNEAPVG